MRLCMQLRTYLWRMHILGTRGPTLEARTGITVANHPHITSVTTTARLRQRSTLTRTLLMHMAPCHPIMAALCTDSPLSP